MTAVDSLLAGNLVRSRFRDSALSEMQSSPEPASRPGAQMPTLFRRLLVLMVLWEFSDWATTSIMSLAPIITVWKYPYTLEWFQRDDANPQIASKQGLPDEVDGQGRHALSKDQSCARIPQYF